VKFFARLSHSDFGFPKQGGSSAESILRTDPELTPFTSTNVGAAAVQQFDGVQIASANK